MAVWHNFIVLGVVFTSDSWVLQAVSGYKIEFICEPFQVRKPHGIAFSVEEKKFIDLEVQKMLQKGAPETQGKVRKSLRISL